MKFIKGLWTKIGAVGTKATVTKAVIAATATAVTVGGGAIVYNDIVNNQEKAPTEYVFTDTEKGFTIEGDEIKDYNVIFSIASPDGTLYQSVANSLETNKQIVDSLYIFEISCWTEQGEQINEVEDEVEIKIDLDENISNYTFSPSGVDAELKGKTVTFKTKKFGTYYIYTLRDKTKDELNADEVVADANTSNDDSVDNAPENSGSSSSSTTTKPSGSSSNSNSGSATTTKPEANKPTVEEKPKPKPEPKPNPKPQVTPDDNTQDNAPTKSSNAKLASLSVSVGTLSPAFSPDVDVYDISLPAGSSSITVSGTAQDSTAKYHMGIGTHNLNPGENNIKVVLIAEDGETREIYTIRVRVDIPTETLQYISLNTHTTYCGVNGWFITNPLLSPADFGVDSSFYGGAATEYYVEDTGDYIYFLVYSNDEITTTDYYMQIKNSIGIPHEIPVRVN